MFQPGRDPLARLRDELAKTQNPSMLVVDQFEELFTLCESPAKRSTRDSELEATDATEWKRQAFLDELLPLRKTFPVVLTMRADFIGDCIPFDELYKLLDGNKFVKLVQPLNSGELRHVMERQAKAVGLGFDLELAALIIRDLAGEPARCRCCSIACGSYGITGMVVGCGCPITWMNDAWEASREPSRVPPTTSMSWTLIRTRPNRGLGVKRSGAIFVYFRAIDQDRHGRGRTGTTSGYASASDP